MRQNQEWKKRPVVLAGDMKSAARCWLNRTDDARQETAEVPPGQKRAGLKKRKF